MGSEADLFSLVGRTLVGKYDVTRTVARGGFGLVYQGLHRTLRKQVAIKVLIVPEEFNDRARANFMEFFLREAQTIAQLKHPAVVQVLDSGVDAMPTGATAPWMVLEWIDGQTLEDHLKARQGRGGRPPEEVLAILRPVLEALAYAHEQGIAHRDLKPANLMLPAHTPRQSRHGLPGIQLLDFGIAKVMDPSESSGSGATRTASNQRAFSPLYAAPEQVGGSRTGPWTDVHAMGLILTEMLTDRPPFEAQEQTELFIKVLSPHRPSPRSVGVDVGGWEPVIARCLSLMPRDRFASAGELLTALEEGLRGAHARTIPTLGATVTGAPSIPPPVMSPPVLASTREVRVQPISIHSTLRAMETSTTPKAPTRRSATALALFGSGLALLVLLPLSYALVNTKSTPPPVAPVTAATAPHTALTAAPSPVVAPMLPVVNPPAVQVTVPAPLTMHPPAAIPPQGTAPVLAVTPAPVAPASAAPPSPTVTVQGNPSHTTARHTGRSHRGRSATEPTQPAARGVVPPAFPPPPRSSPASVTPGLGRGDL